MFAAGFGGAGTYSSSRSSRPRGPPRKKDSIVQYPVTLEELYNGKKVGQALPVLGRPSADRWRAFVS